MCSVGGGVRKYKHIGLCHRVLYSCCYFEHTLLKMFVNLLSAPKVKLRNEFVKPIFFVILWKRNGIFKNTSPPIVNFIKVLCNLSFCDRERAPIGFFITPLRNFSSLAGSGWGNGVGERSSGEVSRSQMAVTQLMAAVTSVNSCPLSPFLGVLRNGWLKVC